MSRFVLLLVSSAVLALCGMPVVVVHASLPACTDSLPDVDGHYVYTASPTTYISTAASTNLATQDFTASMWVNPTARLATGFTPLVGQGPDNGCGAGGPACTSNLFIGYEFDSVTTHYTLVLGVGFDGVNQQMYNSVSAVANVDSDIGQWQLYVFTYDHAAFQFAVWRNGQPLVLSAGGILAQAYTGPAAVVCIGCAGGGTGALLTNFFVGSIDEPRLWYGIVLAPSEIGTLWCDNSVTTAAPFYMTGGDFLSNGGTAQTVSTPAPALSGSDVTNECYGSCKLQACASGPCQNGGTCQHPVSTFNATTNVTTTHSDVFSCACAAGYTGTFCQTDINECASSPCQNGGVCIDLVNAFFCNCTQPPMPDCGACANPISLISNLGGQTLAPGCYIPTGSEPFGLTGTVTLSGSGRYQFASAQPMTTDANSIVQLVNGADCRRVTWCMTSAITLGANSFFIGSMRSNGAISIGSTVSVEGEIVSDTTINYGGADSIGACSNNNGKPVFSGPTCAFVYSNVTGPAAAPAPSSSAGVVLQSSSGAAAAATHASSSGAAAAAGASTATVNPAVSSSGAVAPAAGPSSSGPVGPPAVAPSSSGVNAPAAVPSSSAAAAPADASTGPAAAPDAGSSGTVFGAASSTSAASVHSLLLVLLSVTFAIRRY